MRVWSKVCMKLSLNWVGLYDGVGLSCFGIMIGNVKWLRGIINDRYRL